MAAKLAFSALPTGPMATVMLYLTEGDMARVMRTHLEMKMKESEVASHEFWRGRCCSTFGRHVDSIQVSAVLLLLAHAPAAFDACVSTRKGVSTWCCLSLPMLLILKATWHPCVLD